MAVSLLVAEDEAAVRELTVSLVKQWPGAGRIVEAENPEQALARAEKESFSLALVDLHYEQSSRTGFDLIEGLKKLDPQIEIIVVSSAGTFQAVQQAMRAGASDYLAKGFGRGELYHALDRALERRRWRKMEAKVVRASPGIIGRSPLWEAVTGSLRKFGPSLAPVLIHGETGTGKELVARQLHAFSRDPASAFVAVNCAALPEGTADSYFFGHEKGAFTGADRARAGVFEEADGGTLFLDEVNSLPPEMQGKLLRILEQKEVRRMGSGRTLTVDFRLVAATNADLEDLIAKGRFREDLYYRLSTLLVRLPPLRERLEDLPELAASFFPARRLDDNLWDLFRAHSWPGNIREFRNLLTAMDALAEAGEILSSEHIPEHMLRKIAEHIPAPAENIGSFAQEQSQREEDFLKRAYRSAGGNVSRMARMLKLDRSHLHQKLVKLGIHQAKA